jgi:hypothetical protein
MKDRQAWDSPRRWIEELIQTAAAGTVRQLPRELVDLEVVPQLQV